MTSSFMDNQLFLIKNSVALLKNLCFFCTDLDLGVSRVSRICNSISSCAILAERQESRVSELYVDFCRVMEKLSNQESSVTYFLD